MNHIYQMRHQNCHDILWTGPWARLLAIAAIVLWEAVFCSDGRAGQAAGSRQLRMILNPGSGTGQAVAFEVSAETPDDQAPPANPQLTATQVKLPADTGHRPVVTLGAGWRRDHLDWDISSHIELEGGGFLPAASQLEWDRVDSLGLSLDFKWHTPSRIYLRANAGAGFVLDGSVRDSDYLGTIYDLEFSRSYADSDDGLLLDFCAGIGFAFEIPIPGKNDVCRLIPLAGYSRHTQDLEMTRGVQYLSDYGWSTPLGPMDGLDSSYDTRWQGPWIGLDFELLLGGERHMITGSVEYHWADYSADANWNLRQDLAHPVSFSHDASGTGLALSLGYITPLWEAWSLTLGVNYRKMKADSGSSVFYFSDGSRGHAGLNNAEWESCSLFIGLTYCF